MISIIALNTLNLAQAQELAVETIKDNLYYIPTILFACLIFFLQAGFVIIEVGFTRTKKCA